MREVRDDLDLQRIKAARRGFILNVREDRKMLHRAACESVGTMGSANYTKLFFEEPSEVVAWLESAMFEQSRWNRCGRCRPLDS